MTDKELRKLNRSALLEMLVEQSRENDRLRAQVDELQRLLSDRQLKINQAGSIAEASLQLNQVFEAPSKRLNSIWKISGHSAADRSKYANRLRQYRTEK